MFAFLSRDNLLYFKAKKRKKYLGAQFSVRRMDKAGGIPRHIGQPYYQAPDGVLDDGDALLDYARRAVAEAGK